MVKLLDYGNEEEMLETSANPFACLVLAHLKTLETREDTNARERWKIRVIRILYERGFGPERIRQLFRLVDWMLELPEELDSQFRREVAQLEEDKQMNYVTSIERLARKEGLVEGKADTLLRVLERSLQTKLPSELAASVRATTDIAKLDQWVDLALEVSSLEEFREKANL